MPRWQICFCFALLALSVSAQIPDLGELEDFLGGLDLDELISAGEKCDSDKLDAADEACSAALESNPNTICPPACQELFNTLNDECGQFINAIGLSGLLLENCGIGANIPTPLDEPTDDVDYTEPPLPPSDYEDDYTGTAPEAAPTVTPLPISIASPTPTPTPSPDPPVIPSPVPYTPTVAGFPASCDSYFASLNSDDQLSCGLALADNPIECPDACKRLYNTRPDATCQKDLEAMSANDSPMADNNNSTDVEFYNPCFAALTGASSRSSSSFLIAAGVAAVATLVVW